MNNDNIELRSDKVRNIIGQIPPWIVRSGTTVIVLIIATLLTGSYYLKYPYTVIVPIDFYRTDNAFIGVAKIPAKEISKIKKGQVVEIYFNRIKGANNLAFTSTVVEISKNIIIANKEGFYIVKIREINNLKINEQTSGIANIKTEDMSLFERIIKPFRILKK